MKNLGLFIITILLFIPHFLHAKDAWSLNAEFDAKEKEVFGMSAKSIDPNFEKISLLTADMVIKKYPEAKKDLADGRSVFSLEKTPQKKKHRIVVGVYSGAQEKGSFLLVVKNEKGKWKVAFVSKTPGKMGLGILQDAGDSILWNNCLACGHSAVLKWNDKEGYYFESTSDDSEE